MKAIQLSLSEANALSDIVTVCRSMIELTTDKGEQPRALKYHFEVHPTGIGNQVLVVVPEFGIVKDITDYDSF